MPPRSSRSAAAAKTASASKQSDSGDVDMPAGAPPLPEANGHNEASETAADTQMEVDGSSDAADGAGDGEASAAEDGDDNDHDHDQSQDQAGPSSQATEENGDPNLLVSLPVYLSTSLPSTSSLHIFQYPNYPRAKTLPMPDSALSRGLRPAMRWRPKANRVEVELPLDLRPAVYNSDRGQDMAKGDGYGGEIGMGPEAEKDAKRVKKEKASSGSSGRDRRRGLDDYDEPMKRLERTRLKSFQVPHATNYMVGVIRDRALHLTPLDSVLQLRPSMHHLDGLTELDMEEKRRARAAGVDGDESEAQGADSDAGAAAAAAAKRKGVTINVAVRGDPSGGGPGMGGRGGMGGPGGGAQVESREHLMAAQREAEAEAWSNLDWKWEDSDEAKKTFESKLFASSKVPLKCTTKPREFLEII